MPKIFEIFTFKDGDLFGKARPTITEHILHIFESGELDESTSVGFSDERVNNRPAKLYKKN